MHRYLFLIGTFLVSSGIFWLSAQDNQEQLQIDLKLDFDNLYKDQFNPKSPGGCVVVLKGDDIVYRQCGGLSDLKTKSQIDPNTIFNTGSISKTVVAYGILILEEQGKLSIEDDLITHFPDFDNPDVIQGIKIKHLLSHCSGLPDARNVRNNSAFFMDAKDKGNFDPLKKITHLNFEPGQQFEYSNPAFNGLALIIEQTSKMKWQDFIKKYVFTPAGMNDSRITDGPHPVSGVAHGYDHSGNGFVEADYGEFPTFTAAGNGGVWCSIMDLVSYEQAIREAKFLSPPGISKSREIFYPKTWSGSEKPSLGFSWFVHDKEHSRGLNEEIVYHTGSQGGFRSFHYVVPGKDILYIALFNSPPKSLNKLIYDGLSMLKKHQWLE